MTILPVPERARATPPPRPRSLAVALVLCYGLGAFWGLRGLWGLRAILPYDEDTPARILAAVPLLVAAVLYIVAGRGLRKGTTFGRWVAVVIASFYVVSHLEQHGTLPGIALNIVVLVLVFKNWPRSREKWYRRRAVRVTALGACIVVLAGIIMGEISGGRRAAAPRTRVPSPTSLASAGARVWTNQPSPNALKQHIESLPHRAREATLSNAFVGTWVRWAGVVKSVERAAEYYHVGTSSVVGKDFFYTVLEFSLDQRPVVERLRRGDSVFYSGRLREPIRERLSRDLSAFIVDSTTLLRTVPGSDHSLPQSRPN